MSLKWKLQNGIKLEHKQMWWKKYLDRLIKSRNTPWQVKVLHSKVKSAQKYY